MFLSPRIRLKPLAQLCHRLAIATKSGIEDRKIWRDEATRGSRSQRRMAEQISDGLATGQSVVQSLPTTGKFFPPLFHQMVAVGDMSGQLDQTYQRLATHYNRTLTARRAFWSQLSWPLLQLGMALGVVGLLIWIMGMMPAVAGKRTDLLGLGLFGTRGLIIYLNVLVVIAILIFLLIEAARRGAVWTRTLQRNIVKIPVIGPALKTLALARFTWALQLVLDTPMDLRAALPLALGATGNDYYARFGPEVAQRIEQGQTIHTALSATEVFPIELLDNIAVGEESGQLAETMAHQSEEYQDRAATALSILAQLAGYAIWLLVATFIVVLIFRLFSAYLQQIEDLL